MKSILFLLALLSGPAMAANGLIDVDQLNQVLRQQHAGWVAKPTPLNQLDEATVKAMMGVQRPPGAVRFRMPQTRSRMDLPAVLDWRDNNGNNWVTPILDQGFCGSCVAFASIGTLETQYRISTGFAGFNVRLSPQYLFACGGGSCSTGWQPDQAAAFLQSTGVPDESCLPYTSGENDQDVACTAACSNASQRMIQIASYTSPTQSAFDINAIKQALQNGPLVTTLSVYADFMVYSSGVYKHVTGDMLGGHAISIVGYDDNQRALIIRNSWGQGWGQNGFAYVSYDDASGVGDQTWSFTMPAINGAVTVTSPVDYSYYTKNATVTSNSTYANTDSITVSFFDSTGKAVFTNTCKGNSCASTPDVSTLADGQYQVQAFAMDSTGQQLGQSLPQSFYVSNQQPTISLSFTGAQGTDLTQPLTGTVALAISVSTSNGVPLSSVTFHYQGNGWNVARAANKVADGMMMNWGTAKLPNGSYDVWMEGHLTTNGFDEVYTTPHMTIQTQN